MSTDTAPASTGDEIPAFSASTPATAPAPKLAPAPLCSTHGRVGEAAIAAVKVDLEARAIFSSG